MSWSAEIRYQGWDDVETIIGPLRSLECYIRQHQEVIERVELVPRPGYPYREGEGS